MPYRTMLKHRPVRTLGYVLCLLSGLVFLTQASDIDSITTPLVLQMTDRVTTTVWAFMLVAGGTFAAIGHVKHRTALEESGLSFLIGALVVYAIAAIATANPIIGGVYSSRLALGTLVIGVACILFARILDIHTIDKLVWFVRRSRDMGGGV